MRKAAPGKEASQYITMFSLLLRELYHEDKEMAAKAAEDLLVSTRPAEARGQLARVGGIRMIREIILRSTAETPHAEVRVVAGNGSDYSVLVTCVKEGARLHTVGSLEINQTHQERALDFVRERLAEVDHGVTDEMELQSFDGLMKALAEQR